MFAFFLSTLYVYGYSLASASKAVYVKLVLLVKLLS